MLVTDQVNVRKQSSNVIVGNDLLRLQIDAMSQSKPRFTICNNKQMGVRNLISYRTGTFLVIFRRKIFFYNILRQSLNLYELYESNGRVKLKRTEPPKTKTLKILYSRKRSMTKHHTREFESLRPIIL